MSAPRSAATKKAAKEAAAPAAEVSDERPGAGYSPPPMSVDQQAPIASRLAHYKVTFEDGTVRTFNPRKPRVMLNYEQRYGELDPEEFEKGRLSTAMKLAYAALADEGDDFDEFVDSIADFTFVDPSGALGESGKDRS